MKDDKEKKRAELLKAKIELLEKEIKGMDDTDIPLTEKGEGKEQKKWSQRSIFSKKGLKFWDRRKLKGKPDKSFLIKMLFSNGTSRTFVITTGDELFKYRKRYYHLRYEDNYFNLTENQYELIYHEDYHEPISRHIQKIGDEPFHAVNSSNVKPLVKMEYVKILATASEINKYLKMSLILMLILLAVMAYNAYSLNGLKDTLITVLSGLSQVR